MAGIIKENFKNILDAIDNSSREGLVRTPERYEKFLLEFLNPEKFEFTTFESDGYDEMIIQTGIPFASLCEHHVLPFVGTGTIAYIPNSRIVGLSKLARTLETFSRRLQTQERITCQVAEFLMEQLEPKGVGVILKAQHLCMTLRGVRKPGTETITSKMTGVFMENSKARSELLKLI